MKYAVKDYDKSMEVATYKTASDMPERLRNALPDMEELKKLLQPEDCTSIMNFHTTT